MTVASPPTRVFRPYLFRLAIPAVIVTAATAWIGWWSPPALLVVVPFFSVIVALIATGNATVTLSPAGIEWHTLLPRWRFRHVPWEAILSVRRSLFGFGNRIDLTVAPGRYEPVVWGSADRPQTIDVWQTTVVRGGEFVEAVEEWLRWRDGVVAEAATGR